MTESSISHLALFDCKLYQRNSEQEEIVNTCKRIIGDERDILSSKSEFTVIHGKSGVGKTSLARSIRTFVVEKGGYFVSGKFDQSERTEQYAAFKEAVTEFCMAVVARGKVQVDELKHNIASFIKSEQRILTEMIPALRDILEVEKDFTHEKNEVLTAASGKRFPYLFRLLVCAMASHKHPVVFLLDDLHWADESSLELLQALVTDSSARNGVTYIGTYRDDCCSSHLTEVISSLHSASVCVTEIHLDNWSLSDVNCFLSEALKVPLSSTTGLSDFLYSQTGGNPYHILESLRSLHSQNLILLDSNRKAWSWDIDAIKSVSVPRSLLEQITLSLNNLPPESKDFLTYASCLGSTLDESLMKHFSESLSLQTKTVAQKGLIVECDRYLHGKACAWKFSHDGIREAIYAAIPSESRNEFHYRLGRRLWRELTLDEIDEYIFVVVGQLLHGIEKIKSTPEESIAVAKLCLRAGERAVEVTHFRSAMEYLRQGISLLQATSWQNDYDLCLHLYNAAAEVAYCNGDFDYVQELVEITVKHVRTLEQKVQALSTNICVLGTKGRFNEAVELGLSVLSDLGMPCPTHPSIFDIKRELNKIKRKLKGKTYEDLLRLPAMNDLQKISVMKVINSCLLYALVMKTELGMFLGLRLCCLTLDYGQSALSSLGFVYYGLVLTSYTNCIEEGFHIGELGVKMFQQYKMTQWIGRVYAFFYGTIHLLMRPLEESVEHLKYAYGVALEKGDVEYALLCCSSSLYVQLETSTLTQIKAEMQTVQEQMTVLGQDHNLAFVSPMELIIHQLCENDGTTNVNESDIVMDSSLVVTERSLIGRVTIWSQVHHLLVHFLFGNVDQGYIYASICMSYIEMTPSPYSKGDQPFILLLVGLATIDKIRQSRARYKIVRRCLRRLKFYSKHAPCNVLGKQCLLEAEIAAGKKNFTKAFSKFTCAIALSENAGFVLQTALSYERTAKFLLSTRDIERAKPFIEKAILGYKCWGTDVKAEHLKRQLEYEAGR